ncbi:MAG: hypothetical protein ABI612_16065 [Betaproteobacteria bacterium]
MKVRVVHSSEIDIGGHDPDLAPKNYAQLALAEGDSWFSLGGVPAGNILYQLDFPQKTMVVNIADPGDTLMKDIGNKDNMDELRRLVTQRRYGFKWKFILLSGGGNDLIDGAQSVLRTDNLASTVAADYVDADALKKLMNQVQTDIASIVEMRDSTDYNRGTPIFTHTYDYPTPNNSPTRVLGVPRGKAWLSRDFAKANIPAAMWPAVSDYLIEHLAKSILALDCRGLDDSCPTPLPDCKPLPDFYVVNTLGTLVRAAPDSTAGSGDWLNEIHPGISGNRKLARKLAAEIQRMLAERQVDATA